ncbi:MAG: class I SAM-dependent methyltransferase [Anaerolineae bacterium]|nr:class I SAM-dependent methyltransferase [Anaerolineae bacterium]
MNDPYVALVRYYDAETAGYAVDIPAYNVLVERFGGPLLDVGCGTGRVAFALARQGIAVTGIDTSQPMLDRARARQEPIKSSQVHWYQVDVTELTLDERFGLAIFAYNGFMHLLDQDRQIAALNKLAEHIKKGGGLVIDIANPVEMFRVEDTPGLVFERQFADTETGQAVMQQSLAMVDRATQIMSLTWVYDRIGPDGIVHRDLVPLQLRYTMASEMRLLLSRAGFSDIELCGDYDFSPYEEESPRLFVIATRQE